MPVSLSDERVAHLVSLLQEMDRTQRETDQAGQREIAWYYFRDRVEDALGLARGTLDAEPTA